MSDDDDRGMRGGVVDPVPELAEVFDDLETLLKNGDVIATLTSRGINASIALLAAHALRAYLIGDKAEAAEDFATVADEIRARLAASAADPGANGGRPPSNGHH